MDNPNPRSNSPESREKIDADRSEEFEKSAKKCSIPIPSGSGSTNEFIISNNNSDSSDCSEDDKDKLERNCSRILQQCCKNLPLPNVCEASQRRNDQEEHEVAENNEHRIRLADAVFKNAIDWMSSDEDDQSHPFDEGEEPQVLPVPRNAEPAVDEVVRRDVPEVTAGGVYLVPAHLLQWRDRVYSRLDAATPGREHERDRPEVAEGARQNLNRVAAGGRLRRKNKRKQRRKRKKTYRLAALE